MKTQNIRSFSHLIELPSFQSRYNYLKLDGIVGETTFGFDRYLNQILYKSIDWKKARDLVIIRDEGCDLGVRDRVIGNRIIVHHMNPITIQDVERRNPIVFDPEFLVCVSKETHLAIHYGDASLLQQDLISRKPGDTSPWIIKMEGAEHGKEKNAGERKRRSF